MKQILLPEPVRHRLVFYLAMEEYVAARYGEGFFIWQSRPTVIFGRNQDMEAEVNIEYCRSHGIEMYRRKSGGGCVYSDEGNIMLSCITRTTDVTLAFRDYLRQLCEALQGLGLDAVSTAHNDVLVGGAKVSGNAFFARKGSGIVHGTLLYDSDFSVLEKAITPSRQKLESHGIKSVRQRVANLKDLGLRLSVEELKAALAAHFTDSSLTLDASDVAAIEDIENTYLDPGFILGK
ncbi:MAG: lipoate--protein ligase family protein [Bacteroidales bacterium]|nr:lipoate--protein ligase family protein [Bacteroidales bacterium]